MHLQFSAGEGAPSPITDLGEGRGGGSMSPAGIPLGWRPSLTAGGRDWVPSGIRRTPLEHSILKTHVPPLPRKRTSCWNRARFIRRLNRRPCVSTCLSEAGLRRDAPCTRCAPEGVSALRPLWPEGVSPGTQAGAPEHEVTAGSEAPGEDCFSVMFLMIFLHFLMTVSANTCTNNF